MPVTVSKITSPVRVLGNERVVLTGHFDGSTLAVDDAKSGITVASGGTGIFVLTLPGRGSVSFGTLLFTAEDATSAFVTVTAKDASARTVTVLVEDDAGAAIAAPDAVHFMIVVKESSY